MSHTLGSPPPLVARQGCERQRYGPRGERLVAGCIPMRMGPGPPSPSSVEVLLISSRGGKGLLIPKGGWELDESAEDAAARETVEEAGVRGRLSARPVGTFAFRSSKPQPRAGAGIGPGGVTCLATVFALHVAEELDHWPEEVDRHRQWMSLENALRVVRAGWMTDALLLWARQQGWSAWADALGELGGTQGGGEWVEDEDGEAGAPPCEARPPAGAAQALDGEDRRNSASDAPSRPQEEGPTDAVGRAGIALSCRALPGEAASAAPRSEGAGTLACGSL